MDAGDTRRIILADTIARLEAERFAGPRRPDLTRHQPPVLPPVTADQARGNARVLLEALGDVEQVVHLRTRRTA